MTAFKWYRKWKGGIWHHIAALPLGPGPFTYWTQELPGCSFSLLGYENYL